MPRSWCHAVTLLVVCALPAIAGAQAAAPSCTGSAPADSANATVKILAWVSADEVTFRARPQVSARVGNCAGPAVRVLERRNLPERVEAGATYRDVYIAVEIVGRVEASCLAALAGDAGLAAALGGDACGSTVRADTAAAAPP